MLRMIALFLVPVAIAISAPAHAQNVTAEIGQIVSLLEQKDASVEIKETDEGERYIRAVMHDHKFLVTFYGCDESNPIRDCKTVQFYAGFSTEDTFPVEAINQWNAQSRFGRAYVDNVGDPVVEMDVDMEQGGMSIELFLDNVDYWHSVMANFEEFVDKELSTDEKPKASGAIS